MAGIVIGIVGVVITALAFAGYWRTVRARGAKEIRQIVAGVDDSASAVVAGGDLVSHFIPHIRVPDELRRQIPTVHDGALKKQCGELVRTMSAEITSALVSASDEAKRAWASEVLRLVDAINARTANLLRFTP